MLSLANDIKIYVYTGVTDMRKGFNGLSGMVRAEFHSDPTDPEMPRAQIDVTELSMLLSGVSLMDSQRRRKRYPHKTSKQAA